MKKKNNLIVIITKNKKKIKAYNPNNKKKISSPNLINDNLFKTSNIYENPKNKSSIHISPKNTKLKKKLFDFDIFDTNNEAYNPIIDLEVKKKDSVTFKEHAIKKKIEKDLSLINNSELNENNDGCIKINDSNKFEKKIISNSKIINIENKKENQRKIMRTNHLYDSLEDSEMSNDCEEENFFISPDTKIILIFDFLIMLFLIIYIIYVPLKIIYYKHSCIFIKFYDKIYCYLIDVFFIIDFLIGFYRGYYNHELKLIINNKKILKKYLSTYFFYDLISAFPFLSLIINYDFNNCILFNINNNKEILIVISIFLKLFKSVKVNDRNKFMDIVNEFFSKNFLSEQIYNNIKMFIISFLLLHTLVCFHIFIGYHYHPSWLFSILDKNDTNNYLSIYITSFYFLITTLTTVGYGDIVCISAPERIFQIIELSLGVILYSYIITKVGDMVKNESYLSMIYNNKLAILEDIRISYPKMPFKLYKKITHHLQENIRNQKNTNTNFLINSLPHILKHNLLFIIYNKYINNFCFFKNCYNSNFIIYSVNNFIPITSKKNALIIKEDQLIDNVVFNIDGRLSLEIAIDLENPMDSINKYLSEKYNPLIEDETDDDKYSLSPKNNNRLSTILAKNHKNFDSLIHHNNIHSMKGINNIKRDFDESNYQFLPVSNLFKNEHFGEVFIIINKPSPLFLRVKSKTMNLFLLNKKNILQLAESYFNIWKRLYKKSLNNMIVLKKKVIEVVQKYNSIYMKNYPCYKLDKIEEESKNESVKEEPLNSGNIKNFISNKTDDIQSKIRHSLSINLTIENNLKEKPEIIKKNETFEKIQTFSYQTVVKENEKDELKEITTAINGKNQPRKKLKRINSMTTKIIGNKNSKKEKSEVESLKSSKNSKSDNKDYNNGSGIKILKNEKNEKRNIKNGKIEKNNKNDKKVSKNKKSDIFYSNNENEMDDIKNSKNEISRIISKKETDEENVSKNERNESFEIENNKLNEEIKALRQELEKIKIQYEKCKKELIEEKKNAKYYQKLYKEVDKKNKDLYYKLLNKSINSDSFMGNNDNDSITNINKVIINNINNVSNKTKRRLSLINRSFTVKDNKNTTTKSNQKNYKRVSSKKNKIKNSNKKLKYSHTNIINPFKNLDVIQMMNKKILNDNSPINKNKNNLRRSFNFYKNEFLKGKEEKESSDYFNDFKYLEND